MQKITPHLWFDKEAQEAARFYVDAFGDGSAVTNVTTIPDTPSGDCDVVAFELRGYELMSISAGPHFQFTPAISFLLNFDPSHDADAAQDLDRLWQALSDGGTALMPLDEYPFSKRYGWIRDRYGVTWQLMLTDPAGEERPFVTPSLLFVGDVCGKAEAAIDFYVSVFEGSRRGVTARYPSGMEPEREGTLMFADFQLFGQWFAAMDSAREHAFGFNEAISLMVSCATQDEIDYYWEKLSAVPEAEQCGWLKDRFGISWQIVPSNMNELMSGSAEKIARVTRAFLPMKKFDLAELERAARGA